MLQDAHPRSSKELKIGKKNLTDNINHWCFPCHDTHMPRNFPRGNLQQKVAKQYIQGSTSDLGGYVYASLQMENMVLIVQIQGMSLEQETYIDLDHTLFSWMKEEESVFANDASTSKASQVQSDYNTCSKRRFTGDPVIPQLKSSFDQTPSTSAIRQF